MDNRIVDSILDAYYPRQTFLGFLKERWLEVIFEGVGRFVILLLVYLCARWVRRDAAKFQAAEVKMWSPRVWFWLVFLAWAIFFPAYLIARSKWKKQMLNVNINPTDTKS